MVKFDSRTRIRHRPQKLHLKLQHMKPKTYPSFSLNPMTPSTQKILQDSFTPGSTGQIFQFMNEINNQFYSDCNVDPKNPSINDPRKWNTSQVEIWAKWIYKTFQEQNIPNFGRFVSQGYYGQQVDEIFKRDGGRKFFLTNNTPLLHWQFLVERAEVYNKSVFIAEMPKVVEEQPSIENTLVPQREISLPVFRGSSTNLSVSQTQNLESQKNIKQENTMMKSTTSLPDLMTDNVNYNFTPVSSVQPIENSIPTTMSTSMQSLQSSTMTNSTIISNPNNAVNNEDENLKKQENNYQNFKGGGTPHLWHFILELLLEPKKFQKIVAWTGNNWEFKFIEPDDVAVLWGQKKSKPQMNYEKMSRGIRYYYEKNIIKKIAHYRYVYEFACPQLLTRILQVSSAAEIHSQCGVVPKNEEDKRARANKDPVPKFFDATNNTFLPGSQQGSSSISNLNDTETIDLTREGPLVNLHKNRYMIDRIVDSNSNDS